MSLQEIKYQCIDILSPVIRAIKLHRRSLQWYKVISRVSNFSVTSIPSNTLTFRLVTAAAATWCCAQCCLQTSGETFNFCAEKSASYSGVGWGQHSHTVDCTDWLRLKVSAGVTVRKQAAGSESSLKRPEDGAFIWSCPCAELTARAGKASWMGCRWHRRRQVWS